MKRSTMLLILVLLLALAIALSLSACSRTPTAGESRYGAGGGQSLRKGSTAPYHSPIAQNQTYQKLLGLNILLYPAPVDDPKFQPYGRARWDFDTTAFVDALKAAFQGQMGTQAVYEPAVSSLQDQPLVSEIQKSIYGDQPVQVGWTYGKNDTLDLMEYNGVTVTLVTAYPVVLFVGGKDKLDTTAWTFDTAQATAIYVPENTVVELGPNTLHSLPIRVLNSTGELTAVIAPQGLGVEAASPGSGMDQALVAKDRWVFAMPGVPGGYYAGLTGSKISINPAD